MVEKGIDLFVVEGLSEETALALLLEKLLDVNVKTHFFVMHTDVFTRYTIGGRLPLVEDVRSQLTRDILEELKKHRFKWGDLNRIVQLTDTDGCMISDDCIRFDPNAEDPVYTDDEILTANVEGIARRNKTKRATIKGVVSKGRLTYSKHSVPHLVYYLSRNLEHALYGKDGYCSDEEKTDFARAFRRRYRDCPYDFVKLLNSDEIKIDGDYKETWDYLGSGTNSLLRGSNLRLLFEH